MSTGFYTVDLSGETAWDEEDISLRCSTFELSERENDSFFPVCFINENVNIEVANIVSAAGAMF